MIPFKILLREYGESVVWKRKIQTVDEDSGHVISTSYSTAGTITAIVDLARAESQSIERYGIEVTADYTVVVPATINVSLGDLIVLSSGVELEVTDILTRKIGSQTIHKELIARRKAT